MQSATKREHKAKAAQAITLASRSTGVFVLFFFSFFCERSYKDRRDTGCETRRRRYPRTISSAVRGPETHADARIFAVYTKTPCDVQASHPPLTHTLVHIHTYVILSSLAIFARLLRNAISCRRGTQRQHPARQITALFALPGTSKRNKDLGASWFLNARGAEKLRGGVAKRPI